MSAKTYFEKYARNFISYYKIPNIPLFGNLKSYLWKDLYAREEIAISKCEELENASCLDIGCGDGRHAIKLLQGKARKVVCIDVSREMIEIAKDMANKYGIVGNVTFICDDFFNHHFDEVFDYTIALGVMDYIDNPVDFLEKAVAITRKMVVVSMPKNTWHRGSVRRLKYWSRNCPLHLYTRSRINQLMAKVDGIDAYELTPIAGLGMDFVLSITPKQG